MFKLHLKTHIRDVLTDLTVIEEQVKTNLKPSNSDKKQHLKNPCRIHNGGHEWDDCRQNPKNVKSDDKNKTNGRTDHNGGRTRENRRTENDRRTPRSRSNSQTRGSDSEYEYHGISEREEIKDKFIPSSEILHEPDVAILFHDGKYWAVIPAASWLNDSELEPFEDVSFDFFPVRIGNLELFHINWFFCF